MSDQHSDTGRATNAHVERPGCFVAYSSLPADRAESIEDAIEEIRNGGVVDIVGWKDLAVGGRVVINAICDEIKNRSIFIADITGLNPNVLFELGYAIARKRRIWLLLNPNIERAKADFDRFQLLTTTGYAPYSNSRDIVQEFYKAEPYSNLSQTLYEELLLAAGPPSTRNALFYLRCDVNTEASMRLARRVSSGPIKSLIDDPQEIRFQPFAWYVQQVTSAFVVVCHFLSSEYQHWELHNAKHALVAGLAHGLAKPLLMLAHDPYSSPLDYRDLLRKHQTARQAEAIFADWVLPYIEQYERRIAQVAEYAVDKRKQKDLREISVGDPVAEFESDSLLEYYVSTAPYIEALNSKYSILVGRKGTGKTATLFRLMEDLAADPRNQVTVIKPVAYELEGLLAILRQELSRAEKGYLVESFWKFLLYTELAKSTYEELLGKPEYYVRTTAEAALCEFVNQYQSLITPEFSVRLETAVAHLRELGSAGSGENRRFRISELLHSEMLSRLRTLLGKVLENKAKVSILVDNLDKAWNPNADLVLLSDLIFGLLSSSRRVTEEFSHDSSGRAAVNLCFVLLLRSDIFASMLNFAKERDKLPVRLITWNDPEILRRVIEARLLRSDSALQTPQDVWERFFVPTVRGIPTWQYISSRILPRPRDLIFFVKSAIQSAVNRGRARVEESDFVEGEKQYSRYAIESLITEAGARTANIEDFLVQFVQSSEIITDQEILAMLPKVDIATAELDNVIDWLAQLTFIGFETSPNHFEFLYDERDARKLLAMAQKTAFETTNGIKRFRIHSAFQAFLEVKPHNASIPGQMIIGL